ncbi:MAG: MoaD/ThiS family protein [Ilumatobacter sp.]|nr:MoaD/ThiS family protein [Ilumatobacter sp.]
MAQVTFAKALQRHVDCPPATIEADTLRGVFDGYFAQFPAARTYVLDEHGAVRRHIAVFVAGELIADRGGLADGVDADDDVHVFQALSGGAT